MGVWTHVSKPVVIPLVVLTAIGALLIAAILEFPTILYRETVAIVGGALIGQITLAIPELARAREHQVASLKRATSAFLLGLDLSTAALGGLGAPGAANQTSEFGGRVTAYSSQLSLDGTEVWNRVEMVVQANRQGNQTKELAILHDLTGWLDGQLGSGDTGLWGLYKVGLQVPPVLSAQMHPGYTGQAQLVALGLDNIRSWKSRVSKSQYSDGWEALAEKVISILDPVTLQTAQERVAAVDTLVERLRQMT